MEFLNKVNKQLNQLLVQIAGFFLVIMILLTCANIFLRLVWVPVRGTFELMGFFQSIVAAFALGYTQMKRGHISVDILINNFSEKTKRILNAINDLICFVFFVLVAWQMIKMAETLRTTGEVTETLRIIYYPFTYAVAFGCITLALVFLTGLMNAVISGEGGKN